MRLPEEVRARFRSHGRRGGRARAARMTPEARRAASRRAATARWIRARFGAASFEAAGLPGGALVDRGVADLAAGKATIESLVVSLASMRLRREGVPLPPAQADPERRLFEMIAGTSGDLAHSRYGAYRRLLSSFADACRRARLDRGRRAP